MKFPWLRTWQTPASPTTNPAPTWRLALGEPPAIAEPPAWQDQRLTVLDPAPFALSPNQRFLVVGEAWLADLSPLGPDHQTLPPRQDPETSSLPWTAINSNPILARIAALWEQLETKTWEHLIGIFALAVWDRQTQQLWLGRDRVGGRTLYYTTTGHTSWVAPQLQALRPYHSGDLDLVALRDYLCCAFVPGDRTLWQSVREVRPGTTVLLPDGAIQPYWQLQEQVVGQEKPLSWHGDRLRSLLEQVVKQHLPMADPVGVFLSGGLDSSGVTALAAKLHPHPIHTYSIHFGAMGPNELEFSHRVAHHCQTRHHILEISPAAMWEHLPETMACLDDPIGDPLTVPNLLLGRMAKESVGVVLNGEGGDPCFGGPKNQPMLINRLYGPCNPQDNLQAYLMAFQKCAGDLPDLLQAEVWAAVQTAASPFMADLDSEASYLNRLMALNIKFKGADQILTKVNNLTRAAGIDGRSPLFDLRVVELSMQIPPAHKLSGVREKAVLKQAIADLLPETILDRPKSGMMVPVQVGFREHWNRQARALLLSRQAHIAPYLNQSLIRDWLNYQGDTWGRYGVKLWLLTSLETWLQVHAR